MVFMKVKYEKYGDDKITVTYKSKEKFDVDRWREFFDEITKVCNIKGFRLNLMRNSIEFEAVDDYYEGCYFTNYMEDDEDGRPTGYMMLRFTVNKCDIEEEFDFLRNGAESLINLIINHRDSKKFPDEIEL